MSNLKEKCLVLAQSAHDAAQHAEAGNVYGVRFEVRGLLLNALPVLREVYETELAAAMIRALARTSGAYATTQPLHDDLEAGAAQKR